MTTRTFNPRDTWQLSQGHFSLVGPIAPGWEMITPLVVRVEQDDDGSYVIDEETFMVYGSGETLAAAQQDYVASLLEYYQLVADGARENLHDQATLRKLKTYLQPQSS